MCCIQICVVHRFLQCTSQTSVEGQLFWKMLSGEKSFFLPQVILQFNKVKLISLLQDFLGSFNMQIQILNLKYLARSGVFALFCFLESVCMCTLVFVTGQIEIQQGYKKLINTIKSLDLIDIYRICHLKMQEYTFFVFLFFGGRSRGRRRRREP